MGLSFVLATLAPEPAPYIALMLGGFVVALLGHITRTRAAVAIGIALVFLGVVVLPLLVFGNPH